MQEQVDVAVIGAGISGLAAAFWLQQEGFSVRVLEKADAVGGCIQTRRDQGYLIEHGPNSGLETNPVIGKLVDAIGLRDKMIYANPDANRRYVMRNGKIHVIPTSPGAFLSTKLFSIKARMRVLGDFFVGRAENKEETVADFVRRRLGPEFLDYAINPFVAGVFAGDPEQLSVRAAFPKLVALEDNYGGIFKGVIGGRKERKKRAASGEESKQSAKMFSFTEGMGALPLAVAAALGDGVRTGATVESVTPRDGGWSIGYKHEEQDCQVHGRALLMATPAYVTASMIGHLDGEATSALQSIPYAKVVMAFLGFQDRDVPREMDGFGYLVPEKEKRHSLGTLWSGTIFPGRAPSGKAALTNFLGGARNPAMIEEDDETIIKLLGRDLDQSMGIKSNPEFTFIRRWPRAIPQYTLGHKEREAAMDKLESDHRGLYLTGNHRGGISVADCIGHSKDRADHVAVYLRAQQGA